jgi:hypothetical protein
LEGGVNDGIDAANERRDGLAITELTGHPFDGGGEILEPGAVALWPMPAAQLVA